MTDEKKSILLTLDQETYFMLINMASDSDRTATQMLRNLIKSEHARQVAARGLDVDPSDDISSPVWGEVN